MRHRHGYKKLGRVSSHRQALLKNLSIALIKYKKIETTIFKAKELQSYIEKLVTASKNPDFNTHRFIFAHLQNKEATKAIITEIAPKFANRNGGYTRIQRSRTRRGDASQLAVIGFVE